MVRGRAALLWFVRAVPELALAMHMTYRYRYRRTCARVTAALA